MKTNINRLWRLLRSIETHLNLQLTSNWNFVLRLLPVTALICVLLSLSILTGCETQLPKASPVAVAELKSLLGETSAPCATVIYIDCTPSRLKEGLDASWIEVESRADSFVRNAKHGSKLEIYATGNSPGKLQLVGEMSITERRRSARTTALQKLKKQLKQFQDSKWQKTRNFEGSFVLEDSYRSAVRVQALRKNLLAAATSNKKGSDVECRVIILSDLQQYSDKLKYGSILKELRPGSKDGASVRRTLNLMPPLPGRTSFDIVYFPGQSGGKPLLPKDEQTLKNFFSNVTNSWGHSGCHFYEPMFLKKQ